MKKNNIQIFRILSCIGILMVHMGQHIDIANSRHYTDYGAFGVQLFFMISAVVSFLQFENRSYFLSVKNYINYLKRRLLRILPLFYYIIILYYIFYCMIDEIPYDNTGLYWWRYVFLIFQLIPSENDFWMNIGGVWSISAFLLYYLVSPILWKYINSYKKSGYGLLLFLIIIEILLKIGFVIPKVVLFQEFFLLGIMIYFAVKEKRENQFIFLMCILFLIIGLKKDFLPVVLCYRNSEVIFFSIICAILIVSTWGYEVKCIKIQRIVDIFDNYTYFVYLCHSYVISVVLWLIHEPKSIFNYTVFAILVIIGTACFSVISKIIIDYIIKTLNIVKTKLKEKLIMKSM